MHFIYGSLISLTSAVRGEDNLFLLISHVACKGPLEVSGPTSCSEHVQSQQIVVFCIVYKAGALYTIQKTCYLKTVNIQKVCLGDKYFPEIVGSSYSVPI